MPNGPSEVGAGAPNAETYTDNGDGTVTDTVTGLMWQKAVAAGTFTQAQAVAFCPTLTLADPQRLAPSHDHRADVHRGSRAVESKHQRHVFPGDAGGSVLVFVSGGRLAGLRVERLLRPRQHERPAA